MAKALRELGTGKKMIPHADQTSDDAKIEFWDELGQIVNVFAYNIGAVFDNEKEGRNVANLSQPQDHIVPL